MLPTGRNLYGTDPRAVPSRTACEIGRRAADAIAERHAQDHGEWPRALVLDLWASATMRTSGEDLAQALAHLGVRPRWDHDSARVAGFDILPYAALERPRVDVTLRISGLFRDIFPAQITMFDEAVRAVAALDEDDEINPLAAARRAGEVRPWRIFGDAPERYGLGLARAIDADAMVSRRTLGETYLAAGSHAYGGAQAAGEAVAGAFAERVAVADAFVHTGDMADGDTLDSAATTEAELGFAAAAETLSAATALYHLDSSSTDRLKVRTQTEEIARIVRGRAANPRWIAGQMRHGYRGAAEIAETVDNLYAAAVMSDAVTSGHFDSVFAATCGADAVRAFLLEANPRRRPRHRRALPRCRHARLLDEPPQLRRRDAGRHAGGGMSGRPDPELRKGWCPGALRPMMARDGLLVRLKITGGIVPAGLARAIADLAERDGKRPPRPFRARQPAIARRARGEPAGAPRRPARARTARRRSRRRGRSQRAVQPDGGISSSAQRTRGTTRSVGEGRAAASAFADDLLSRRFQDRRMDPSAAAFGGSPSLAARRRTRAPTSDPWRQRSKMPSPRRPRSMPLPPKFGVLLDDGGTPSLAGEPADLRLCLGRRRLRDRAGRARRPPRWISAALRPRRSSRGPTRSCIACWPCRATRDARYLS